MALSRIPSLAAVGLALTALLALGSVGPQPARAEGEVCRHGSQSYLPEQTLCLDNILFTCQGNGAWVSSKDRGCVNPMYTATTRSCPVGANRTAAHGARACVSGRRSQCSDGDWVDLGRNC